MSWLITIVRAIVARPKTAGASVVGLIVLAVLLVIGGCTTPWKGLTSEVGARDCVVVIPALGIEHDPGGLVAVTPRPDVTSSTAD